MSTLTSFDYSTLCKFLAASDHLNQSIVDRASAMESFRGTKLQTLTADAVLARREAAHALYSVIGMNVGAVAPHNGGWSFFVMCSDDDTASILDTIRKLGYRASRHEVGDRSSRGYTFYANVE
jgi:hypothetical protein